jgi:transposase
MEVVYPHCAGLDVHKKSVTATVIHSLDGGKKRHETRTFATTTRELLALRDWLLQEGCTHVAMESTGVYWQPVYNVLEGGVELLLVNAKHIKYVDGRKTDVRDSEWLAELLRHGLVRPSFVPPRPQRDLRDLTRNRAILVAERATIVNRIQKVLEGANLKLSCVASDVVGVSGRAILSEMLGGEEAPEVLAALAKGRLKEKQEALQAALEGRIRDHHRFLLTQHLAHLDFLEAQVAAYDAQVVLQMERMDALSGAVSPASPETSPTPNGEASPQASSAPAEGTVPAEGAASRGRRHRVEPEAPLGYVQAVRLLDSIPGVGERVAQAILAEIGTDMSRFPTAAHLAAWAGMAPGNNESAGKRRSGKTTEGNAALRKALTQAAHGAKQTKDSFFAARYQRLVGRRGKRRAIVAVGHGLLVVIYHMLRYHEEYRELGRDYYDERRKESLVEYLVGRIERLGYKASVELKTLPQAA